MKRLICLLSLILISGPASAQVFELAEMNTRQIAALDRGKTVVLIPGGLMEQHGPYLPANADGYMSEWLTRRLAERLVERPGWTVVIFPTKERGAYRAPAARMAERETGAFENKGRLTRGWPG